MEEGMTPIQEKRAQLLAAGVIMMDPASVYVDSQVTVGEGTVLLPGTILRGDTHVGAHCEIGPNTMLTDCTVEDHVHINTAQCEQSEIRARCEIGPYTHIRPHCVVGEGSKIGAFVQLKNCNLGAGTKMAHLTYVGDADVGERVNFGCGTVTCNYDGNAKYRTVIGDDCFLSPWAAGPTPPRAPRSRPTPRRTAWSSAGRGRRRSPAGPPATGQRRKRHKGDLRLNATDRDFGKEV